MTTVDDSTGTPARRRLRPAQRLREGAIHYWWAEILLVLGFYFVYSAIRNAKLGGRTAAFANARTLIDVQEFLGISHERVLQDWALHFKPLIVAANYFYGSAHFVVTIGVLVFLFVRWPDDYRFWRTTLGFTTALALVGFTFWPLMPPRLLPESYGYVDTLAKYPTFWSFDSGAVSKISNQFAAMPSVHCAWALWCACVLVPRVRTRWARRLAIWYPVLTVLVIVLTGNHFVLDAVGGFAILGIGFLLARRFARRSTRWFPRVVRGARSTPGPAG